MMVNSESLEVSTPYTPEKCDHQWYGGRNTDSIHRNWQSFLLEFFQSLVPPPDVNTIGALLNRVRRELTPLLNELIGLYKKKGSQAATSKAYPKQSHEKIHERE